MGCNCGKKKINSQPKKIVKPQKVRQNLKETNSVKRIIRRTAY